MKSILIKIGDEIIRHMANVYFWLKHFFWEGNFKKKHISFGIVDGKFQFTSVGHEDFIKGVREKIKLLSKLKRKEFIRLALAEAIGGCNFIVFSPAGDKNKFLQFWTAEHQLKFDFYANKFNGLEKCYLPIVGLLSEMEFVNSKVESYRGRMVFKIKKNEEYINVSANLWNDLNLAAELVDKIFDRVFHSKYKKLEVKVG